MNEKVKNILAEAMQASNPEERRAWLERACAGDEDLRREVESLLAEYEKAGAPFDHRSDSAPDQEPKPQPKWSGGPPRPPKKTARGLADGSPGDDYHESDMNSENRDAKVIFGEALRLSVPAERAAYLDQACAGDVALRQEVDSLLSAYSQAQAGDFLAHTLPLPEPDVALEHPGTRIGHYKLLEQIGEGGFGVVWMAEQEEPVRRRVALKIIKLGMDTKEVVARFEAERQALAMMDHPNIARVFDGGATDTGRPYFVMELVKGVPITDYCDANQLSTRERLELFMQVCHAVQHAHQKGVIHRDLKPSNVLVTEQDDRPVPKVIDFGVAKATQARLTEKTLFTRFNQWIGTPAYMSPEQAGLGSLDVDTRSDIYSLGVLLYELLTGRTPFDTQKLLAAGYDAVMRTIREEDPPKPSARLSTLAREELNAVAARRGAEPAKLGRLVRGDLDWIVMKALEKDRTRRYETANALALDLERHLNDQPVTAAAPGALYRLQKFVRRNRAALGTAAVLVLITAVGFAGWLQARKKAKAAANSKARVQEVLDASDMFLVSQALKEEYRVPELLNDLDRAIERQPANHVFWNARAVLLERTGAITDAYTAFSRAINLASSNKYSFKGEYSFKGAWVEALSNRCRLLKRMERFAEAGMDYRLAKGLPLPVTATQAPSALPDYHLASAVSIDLGASNREAGLHQIDWPDGRTTAVVVDDQECRSAKAGRYVYYFIDPTFKLNCGSSLEVQVDYFDVAPGSFGIAYDGLQTAYQKHTNIIALRQTRQWARATFPLHDFRFENSQNGNADFRLWVDAGNIFVRRVVLARLNGEKKPAFLALIPPRDLRTPPHLIDLSPHYNAGLDEPLHNKANLGNNLSALPRGLQTLAGVQFDVRGLIELSSSYVKTLDRDYPERVNGIKVARQCRRLHFLHASGFGVVDGVQIASYIVHYADGHAREIPIVYGEHVRDWWVVDGEAKGPKQLQVAWTGRNAATPRIRLFKTTWENPLPDLEVRTIDYMSKMTPAAPFLVALTIE